MSLPRKSFIIIFFSLLQISIVAQVKDPNLGTEVVNVVKPFTPTIADASKLVEVPILDKNTTLKIQNIKYAIFSIPVASTFTPSKGIAANLELPIENRRYDNYASLGVGNYGSALAALFVTHEISKNELVSGMFKHNSSQGNIAGVALDNFFYDTKLDLNYSNKQADLSWKTNFNYQNQVFNWYGLPTNFGFGLTDTQQTAVLSNIDPTHTFHNFTLGGNAEMPNSIFKAIDVQYHRFWDNYNSTENEFLMKPTFKFDVANHNITLVTNVNYLNTRFDKFYQADKNDVTISNLQNQNSYFGVSLNPNYTIFKNDLTLNIGTEVTYLNTMTNMSNGEDFGNRSNVYFYPKLTASYKVVGDLMIAFGGIEGGLNQNSYRNFASQNPFISPTLSIVPTDLQYDINAGLKGKLAANLGYSVKVSYITENNKALFRSNFLYPHLQNDNYAYGNSFSVVYDNVRTLSFFGELKADFTDKISFGINGTFASFDNKFEEEVWNLPSIQIASTLDVTISKKWFAGANVFFVGERKDQTVQQTLAAVFPPQYVQKTVLLPNFFDANINVGYKHNERISAFLKVNNIGNQMYQRWINFPVQQLQVVLGANYKFDF